MEIYQVMGLIALVHLIVFIVLAAIDRRRFINGVVLLLALGWAYMGALLSATNPHLNTLSLIAMLFLLAGPFLVLFLLILLIVDSIVMWKKEGRSLNSLLPAGLAVGIIASCALAFYLLTVYGDSKLARFLAVFAFGFVAYMLIAFAALLLYSFIYSLMPKSVECDYIIIHGCGLLHGDRVPKLLSGRIDKALELYRKGFCRAKFIASGGKGADESISESQAITDYLLAQGVSRADILMEDKSANTYQNLQFSKEIMDARSGQDQYRCLFVTSNYHVFRAGMYARKLHIKGEGMGCHTALYYWPSAFIREYIAILASHKKPFIVWMALFAVLAVLAAVL